MRNPERSRNLALAVCLAGPVLALAALAVPEGAARRDIMGALFAAGLMAFLFGGVAALVLQPAVKRARQLSRGEGLLARWRFAPADWRAFLALDAERNARGDREHNLFVAREVVPDDGIEVSVGEEVVEIDGSVHDLPRHGTPQITRAEFDESRVRPSVIELDLYFVGDGISEPGSPGGPKFALLRFPVPVGQQAQGKAIAVHFQRTGPGKPSFFHGPGDGSDPEDLTRCWNCGFETYKLVAGCERCGATMQSRRWARRYGAILVVLGLLLSIGMYILLRVMLPTLLHPGVPISGTTFTGSRAMANFVIVLLSSVLVFGVTALGYGIYQVVTGRRSWIVVQGMLVIVAGLYVAGLAIQAGWL